jgi:hypothetical protein
MFFPKNAKAEHNIHGKSRNQEASETKFIRSTQALRISSSALWQKYTWQ